MFLCSHGWPGTFYVDHAGLKRMDNPPAFVPKWLDTSLPGCLGGLKYPSPGLEACATSPADWVLSDHVLLLPLCPSPVMKTVLKLHPGISFCGRLCLLPQPVVLPSLPHLSCHACRSSLLFPLLPRHNPLKASVFITEGKWKCWWPVTSPEPTVLLAAFCCRADTWSCFGFLD